MAQLTYRIDVGDGFGGGVTVYGGGWFETEEEEQALIAAADEEAERILKSMREEARKTKAMQDV